MRVFMVGEAASHRDQLLRPMDDAVRRRIELVDLPGDAAWSDAHDAQIGTNDAVISLRFARGGAPLPPIRLLHVPGAGLDGIDLDNVAPQTTVCNVFEHEIPIAEFVLASMLEWEIDIAGMRASFTRDAWADLYRARRPHGEIYGKTLGLIGYGRIGTAIAERARAFGMRVIACASAPGEDASGVVGPEGLGNVLEAADYLAIACPLTDKTRSLLDAEAIARLRHDAVIINVSRAEIAVEQALYDALRNGRIRGASLDVWYRYPTGDDAAPVPSNLDFHALSNVRATPHSCAWTVPLMDRRYAVIAKNIAALFGIGSPFHVIRSGDVDPQFSESDAK